MDGEDSGSKEGGRTALLNEAVVCVCCGGFPGGSLVKNLPVVQKTQFDPWVGKIPWRRKWQSTPVFLPGKIPMHGVPKELDMTGQLNKSSLPLY